MSNTIKEDPKSRKRELLTFLFSSADKQSDLFRKIINKALVERKRFIDKYPQNDELKEYDIQLNDMIYESKLKEIKRQTDTLKEQMIAQANGTKYPSVISIIERKLYIVELQIDIGVHNLLKNNNVKFYFQV